MHHAPANEAQEGQQVNIFQTLNQKLRTMGIPPWNLGDIVIEPIVTVGFLIALLMFGVHGLIFGVVLFAVSRWSQHGAPEIVTRLFGGGQGGHQGGQGDAQSNSNNRPKPRGSMGTGHRLGYD